MASNSLLMFDVSIVLNLPFVNLFLNKYPWLYMYPMQKKLMWFLKICYVENLIVTEKGTTSITFLNVMEA